jgi:hypothetical protein
MYLIDIPMPEAERRGTDPDGSCGKTFADPGAPSGSETVEAHAERVRDG